MSGTRAREVLIVSGTIQSEKAYLEGVEKHRFSVLLTICVMRFFS